MEASHRLEDIFWTTPLKNMKTFPIAEEVIQKKITEIANVASNFYISYKTKWLLTLKVQGLLLGILIGLSPLIFLVSMIPIGNNAVNVNVFFISFITYLLIKLWIPALYLVHYFAYHTLGR
ncbi:MAG TPA: hypothetical protein EYH58_06025 [Aquifex aeolicus]|nr:hypothetical protein [Aquifex aeolicus]